MKLIEKNPSVFLLCLSLSFIGNCSDGEFTKPTVPSQKAANQDQSQVGNNDQTESSLDQAANSANRQSSPDSNQVKSMSLDYQKPTPYVYPAGYNDPALAPTKHLLVWNTDPSTRAAITWSTSRFNPNDQAVAYLSTKQQNGSDLSKYELKISAKETGMFGLCGAALPIFRADVKDLKPNTTYYYVVTSNGQKSEEMHFLTAPVGASVPFKLLSGGDSRSDQEQRIIMNKQLSELFTSDPAYLGLVHGGDFVATGSNCNQWAQWLDDHQATHSADRRIMPIVPTFGNHESPGPEHFAALWGDPLGGNRFYYKINIGPIDLLILNSEISVEGDQRVWLEKNLQASDASARFLIVGYHRPAYPAVKSPGDTITWVPMFEQYRTSLAFESDGHSLKQTCPIKQNSCVEDGVIYVGEGGLGVPQRNPSQADQWYFNNGGYAISQHHIQSLEVNVTDSVASSLSYQVYFDKQYQKAITIKSRLK
jgi:hypothetical protein